jgi:hypothetical protein
MAWVHLSATAEILGPDRAVWGAMVEMDLFLPVVGTILAGIATIAAVIGAVFAFREMRKRGRARRGAPGDEAAAPPTRPTGPEVGKPGAGPSLRYFRDLGPIGQALLVVVAAFITGAVGLLDSQPRLALGLIVVAALLAGYLALPRPPIPVGWLLLTLAAVVACTVLILNLSVLVRVLSPPAQLRVLQGGVQVGEDQASLATARREQSVKRGRIVRTDAAGLAELAYKGTVTRLDKQTTVELVELSGIGGYRSFSVRLDAGAIWVSVAKATSSDLRYELRTAHVVADVHGTVMVQCASGVCSFTSVEGATTLSTIDGDRAVTLNDGQFLMVRADGTLGEATLLSPDQLAASSWFRFNRRLDPMQPDSDELAQATIAGKWRARQTITRTTGPSGLYAGDTWLRVYEIAVNCEQNPCEVRLEGSRLDFGGTTYRTALPPESAPCDGTPGQNQQTFILQAATAALQDGVLNATSLSGTVVSRFTPGRGSQCKQWEYTAELSAPPGGDLPIDYPKDAEEELLNLLSIPEKTCQRETQLPRGSKAGVTCHPPTGVDEISAFKFRSRALMNGHYNKQIRESGIQRDYGFCNEPPDVGTGESAYTVNDRQEGRLLCYRDGAGRRWIWTTVDRASAAFVMVRNDGNWRRLYAFWNERVLVPT